MLGLTNETFLLILKVVIQSLQNILFFHVEQHIIQKHLELFLFPLSSKIFHFLFDKAQYLFTNLTIKSHSVDTYHILLILCFIVERFNNRWVALDLLESCFVLFELLLQICMVCYVLCVLFISLMLLVLPFGLLVGWSSFLQFLVIFLLNFLFVLNEGFIVSYSFVESWTVQTTLDFQRETSIGSQLGISEMVYLCISLHLLHIQIFLLWFGHLAFLRLFSWWLFFLEDFIGLACFVRQYLSDHKLMWFCCSQIFNNFRILGIQLSSSLEVVLFDFLMPMFKLTNVAACQLYSSFLTTLLHLGRQIFRKQVDEIVSFADLSIELLLNLTDFLIFLLFSLN